MVKKITNIRRPILRNSNFESMDKLENRRNLHKISQVHWEKYVFHRGKWDLKPMENSAYTAEFAFGKALLCT